MSEAPFSHVLITRPEAEGLDLSARLAPLLNSAGAVAVLQPAHRFVAVKSDQASNAELEATLGPATGPALPATVVFSSPRAVEFGLQRISSQQLKASLLAAMGPATARALEAAGHSVTTLALKPHNTEGMIAALLQRVEGAPAPGSQVVIVTAAGGRAMLSEWLTDRGCRVLRLLVYERSPVTPAGASIKILAGASRILSLWTSSDAMNAMSTTFPPAAWFRICQGDWLVTSPRLQRLARAFGPSSVHLAAGPSNDEIAGSVRSLFLRQDD